MLKSTSLKVVSNTGESERDFRIRLQLVAREKRDVMVEKLRKKYALRISALEDRIRRAEYAVEREKEQAKQQKMSTAISFGATILGALMGRKTISQSSVGRASTTARSAGRMMKESGDVARASDNLSEPRAKLEGLQIQLTEEVELIRTEIDPLTEDLESVEIRPRKADISVSLVALAWVPYWSDEGGRSSRAW